MCDKKEEKEKNSTSISNYQHLFQLEKNFFFFLNYLLIWKPQKNLFFFFFCCCCFLSPIFLFVVHCRCCCGRRRRRRRRRRQCHNYGQFYRCCCCCRRRHLEKNYGWHWCPKKKISIFSLVWLQVFFFLKNFYLHLFIYSIMFNRFDCLPFSFLFLDFIRLWEKN